MTKEEFFTLVTDGFDVSPDYPWKDEAEEYAVFRHRNNKKWFALYMNGIKSEKIGRAAGETLELVNVKVDPFLLGSLLNEKGVVPAYHMNKEHWVSIVLGEADRATVLGLLTMSYDLTFSSPKPRRPRFKE